jgi:hypothetical protein
MNPFDSAWDFFKAADRRSIADPSASKGSSGGHLRPYDHALGEKTDEIDRKKQLDKKYLAEMASAAPDSPPPPAKGDPRTEEIYEDLPDEAFPQGPPQAGPKSRGNPRGYFQMSEPFDAAWALLKQWEGIDWANPQMGPQGLMENIPVTEDPWGDVDWSRMHMGPDGKPYSHETDPMMRDLYSQGGMERTINRLNSPSPIPLKELYARYLAQRQGGTPSTGALGRP